MSLEGYLAGRLAVSLLQEAGADVTREKFLDAAYSKGTLDLGGVTLTYGPNDNQGLSDVFLTKIGESGHFEAISGL